MTTRTRYFVIVSLLVLGIGLGTGLVAYYVGFPAGAFAKHAGPEELGFIPRDASVVAFANVQEIMTSDVRQRLRSSLPMRENGQRELQDATGINLETDVDRIVACLHPDTTTTNMPGAGMILGRGRFDEAKIEALMRDHGAHVEDYSGKRLIVGEFHEAQGNSFALSFMEPGLAAFGSMKLIRAAARDEESANNLRDVVRGFMALAKMQAGSRPEMQAMMQSLELGGTGKTVALSFDVPSQVFDAVGAIAGQK